MEISAAVMDALAAQYQQSFTRIQNAAELAAQDAWFIHNSFDTDDDARWEAQYLALLAAAGFAAATLTAAYFQTQLDYLGIAPRLGVPDVMDEMRIEFSEYGRSPATRARYLVSEGIEPIEAITDASARVRKLTDVAIRDTEQKVLAELMDMLSVETTWEFVDLDRPDDIFHPATSEDAAALACRHGARRRRSGGLRWKREATMPACGWCQAQASRLLSDKAHERDRGWHFKCDCTWRMVTEAEAKAWAPISPQAFSELTEIRYDEIESQGTT